MHVLWTLSSLLPPPRYLRPIATGVDISDSSIKYVHLERAGKLLRVAYAGEISLKEGVLHRGEVKDRATLQNALREIYARTKIAHVRVSLPEEHAYLFETAIDRDVPSRQIQNMLEFRLEENVPLPPREVYFDYDVHPWGTDDKTMRIAVAAYASGTIDGYATLCAEAGITPLSFEVEAQAIARAALPRGEKGTHMIVDCGKTRTGIGIVHDGMLMYTSTVDLGGKELSAALRRQFGERPEDELTDMKNTIGLSGGRGGREIRETLMATVSAINDEIGRRIQYWNSNANESRDRFVESIILCGGSANLKGFPEYISETLGIETNRANVWQNVLDVNVTLPPIDRARSYGYATAIGLALADYE